MKNDNLSKGIRGTYRTLIVIGSLIIIIAIGSAYFFSKPNTDLVEIEHDVDANEKMDDYDKIEKGIHIRTGFIDAPGMQVTVNNCTTCHSAQLVIQNRMNKERWKATILWMQETQNLWDLGKNEDLIIDYLVQNYPPMSKGRREALTNVQWYELKE